MFFFLVYCIELFRIYSDICFVQTFDILFG